MMAAIICRVLGCLLPAMNSSGLCGRHYGRYIKHGHADVLVQQRATVHETRKVERLAKYGLTPDDWDRMWKEQEGRCAICPALLTPETANIDHDHTTGRVRGLLCRPCNQGLGLFGDDVGRLAAAIVYLSEPPP